jgi:hypothetical protein
MLAVSCVDSEPSPLEVFVFNLRYVNDSELCFLTQADAANLLFAVVASAQSEGVDCTFPGWRLESVVNVARLPPAEPASHAAMRLLCLITGAHYGPNNVDFSGGMHERTAGSDTGSGESPESIFKESLAGLGAASVALAHVKGFRHSRGPESRHGAPRLTRGILAGFVCWLCDAPGVFPDMQERGLLEVLVELVRSSKGQERKDAAVAVATLVPWHDAARTPLRALGAIPLLTEQLKVCPGLRLVCSQSVVKCHFATGSGYLSPLSNTLSNTLSESFLKNSMYACSSPLSVSPFLYLGVCVAVRMDV